LSVEWSGYEGFHRGFSLGAGAKSEVIKAAQSGLDVKGSGELARGVDQVLLSIWAIPAKIAAAGAKSLASVAAPLHPPGFLELRPNNSCMLLFCSAALQLRRADSTGSVMRILEKQAWNGAKRTIF
jgi:hypothetical protein